MRIVVLCIGTPRDPHMAAVVREYETRAGRYYRFETLEVSPGGRRSEEAAAVRAREAEGLLKRVPSGLEQWAITRHGTQMSSRDLAGIFSDMATYGHPGVALLIGGASGLDEGLVAGCARRLSLSRMTLPHDMARLVLAEQVYRAGTISRGHPYHKGE